MYLDAAYIVKVYLNEPDSEAVRRLIREADSLTSSEWSVVEVTCAFRRQFREGKLNAAQLQSAVELFREHAEALIWNLVPIGSGWMRRLTGFVSNLPPDVYLRAGDMVHLMAARESGESEIWTSDRHMLAAASHFGLAGRSAS